ncbi:MAG: hypothetical protein R6X02_30980 [Enhygromyxa sp.]
MRFEILAISGLIASSIALLACADFKRGEYWELDEAGEEQGEGAEGEYGYAADVHSLLDAGCERCHAPGKSADNTKFLIYSADVEQSYASTLEFVNFDSPGDSRLLSKTAGSAHGGGVIFDDRSNEYELILAWIEQGAPP